MKVQVDFGDLRLASAELGSDLAEAATDAMRETTAIAKLELREQVTGSGLGTRLANTWQGDVYPNAGRSLEPAGYIHSRAPLIIDAFSRGATIYPTNGLKTLAIPTENVPQTGRRGRRVRMTPVEVEAHFNQELLPMRGKRGRTLLFLQLVRGRSRSNGRGRARRAGGLRRASAGRLAAGREVERVLMFTLVPMVRLPRLLDLDAVAQRWAARFSRALDRRLGAS